MGFARLSSFVLLITACLCASCTKQQKNSGMISETKAIALAKEEFRKSGRKLEDYNIATKVNSTGRKWIVLFDRKARTSLSVEITW
jgi:hypothetical protein